MKSPLFLIRIFFYQKEIIRIL